MKNPNARLEAFCDGVFAIAITLLIIEIKIPKIEDIHSNRELWLAFLHAWPSWAAFLLSFLTILISWVNHHHAFKLIDKSSARFTYANGLLLLMIVILPFPTAAVAEYIMTDYAQPAISVYCGVSLLGNVGWLTLMHSIKHPRILYKSTVDMEEIRKTSQYTKMGFFLYLFVFILSFFFPVTAFIITAVTFVMWLIVGLNIPEVE